MPTKTVGSDADSALAYKFWIARCFRGGSPEEDLFRAVCVNSMSSGVSAAVPQAQAVGKAEVEKASRVSRSLRSFLQAS